jgi:large subunit ribosomal protein L3
MDGLIGRKVGMTQVFEDSGLAIPCTVLRVGPCVVVQRRETDRDGYEAVQIGLVEPTKVRGGGREGGGKRSKGVNRAQKGHFDKAKVPPMKRLREFRLAPGADAPAVGDKILVSVFKPSDQVDIIGQSKGKGFQGVMKRHHFSGGAASHGSMFHRAPGSVGQSAYPSRTFKGVKMPGRMGGGRVTVKNLKVVRVDEEHSLLVVQGAVPGARGSYLTVSRSLGKPKVQAAPGAAPEKKKKG